MARSVKTVWLAGAGCAALAVVAHANTLHNPFVYDDRVTVLENLSLRTPGEWTWLLRYSLFRPLVNLSYAADYARSGLDPFGYHLTSLVLHVASVALVVALGWRIAHDLRLPAPTFVATIPGALFAVHPLLTEAVGYVSARSEVLCGALFLVALLAARRALLSLRGRDTALAVAALLLAMSAKEVAAALPLVVLAYDRLLLDDPDARRRRALRVHLPFFALIVAGTVTRLVVYTMHESGHAASAWRNGLLQLDVSWRYLGLLVWPKGQTIVHEFSEVPGLWHGPTLLAAAGIVLVFVVAARLRARAPLVLFGVVWFYATLLPSSLLPLAEAMAEHRTYMPSVGVFLIVAAGLAPVGPRAAVALVPLVALLTMMSLARNRVWSDPVRLWQDAVARSPGIYASHYLLAEAYRARGDYGHAAPEYERAAALVPERADPWLDLGICRAELGDRDGARRAFEEAITRGPTNPAPHFDLGLLAEARGDRVEARRRYQETLALDAGHQKARARLAALGPP
jgi:tetratricopeptide (TPR) repeat protein